MNSNHRTNLLLCNLKICLLMIRTKKKDTKKKKNKKKIKATTNLYTRIKVLLVKSTDIALLALMLPLYILEQVLYLCQSSSE